MTPSFHLAFPVTDLDAARDFYVERLGARPGRATDAWADFDLHGHQLSAHRVEQVPAPVGVGYVDGREVPIPHFGLVLEWSEWASLTERLRARDQPFLVEPLTRFGGQPAEQGTFFIADPDGNALEFKAPRRAHALFD